MVKALKPQQRLYGYLRKFGHFLFMYTGSKTGQRRALIVLLDCGEMSQRKLQDILEIKSSSMAEMVHKMECDGLIVRRKDENDARKVLIQLTEKGKKIARAQKKDLDAITDKLFSPLTLEEKEELISLLDKLNVYWDDLRNDPDFLNQSEGVKKGD